jgi:menaquinone-dependent protoporphyrinogen IX oxidase
MKAIVVYESLWGNTAAIARAIAEGIGPEARALSTAEATAVVTADADLIVAGAPVMAFRLPTDKVREMLRNTKDNKAPTPPNLSHPSMRSWLAALPKGKGRAAAFDTQFKWSPGSSASAIMRGLERAGYSKAAKPQKFLMKGTYGPLKDGEVERARAWGGELAKLMQ